MKQTKDKIEVSTCQSDQENDKKTNKYIMGAGELFIPVDPSKYH